MSFVEEVKSQAKSSAKTEEIIKKAIMAKIVEYTKMVGWTHPQAHFSGLDLNFLLLKDKSGWTQHESVDELLYHEVGEAVEFIVHFLQKEKFQVTTSCGKYGVDLTINWENN